MKFKFKCIESSESPYDFTVGKIYEFTHIGDCLTTKDDCGYDYYSNDNRKVFWEEIEDDNQCQN